MIDPITIHLKYDKEGFFDEIPNIHYTEDADIEIKDIEDGWLVNANGKEEVWVRTLDDKIKISRAGEKKPIIILTKDKELLPYCMKDRLAYLQDRTNKEKNEHHE